MTWIRSCQGCQHILPCQQALDLTAVIPVATLTGSCRQPTRSWAKRGYSRSWENANVTVSRGGDRKWKATRSASSVETTERVRRCTRHISWRMPKVVWRAPYSTYTPARYVAPVGRTPIPSSTVPWIPMTRRPRTPASHRETALDRNDRRFRCKACSSSTRLDISCDTVPNIHSFYNYEQLKSKNGFIAWITTSTVWEVLDYIENLHHYIMMVHNDGAESYFTSTVWHKNHRNLAICHLDTLTSWQLLDSRLRQFENSAKKVLTVPPLGGHRQRRKVLAMPFVVTGCQMAAWSYPLCSMTVCYSDARTPAPLLNGDLL